MQFGRGCHLWGRDCLSPFGSVCCMPTSLPLAADGLVGSWLGLLWCLLSPLFCEQAQQCLRLERVLWESSPFLSFFLFFFFCLSPSGYPIVWVAAHISSLRLCSGHSGSVFTLSNAPHTSLFSPCLVVVDMSIWTTSPLGVVVRQIICGFYLLIFFLPVVLPSEIPKLPTDPSVTGFPGVWKLLLFYNSLPGVSLCP